MILFIVIRYECHCITWVCQSAFLPKYYEAISPCTKGIDCYSSHQRLDEMTKVAAMLLAEKFNPTLKKSVIEKKNFNY